MSTIRSLIIPITADADKVGAGLKKAEGALGKFGGAAGVAVGLASAAFSALADNVARQFEEVDNLLKSSQKLGISTEAMAGLDVAAKLSGVSVESVEGAMSKFSKTVGDAALGSTEARKALDDLGLSAADLIGLSPDQQFAAAADALGQFSNHAVRTAVGMDVMGKGFKDLAPLLKDGSGGFRAMQAEADRLNLTVSRLEAEKVERANDAFTKVGLAWDGIGRQIAIAVAPVKEFIGNLASDALANAGRNVRQFREELGKLFGTTPAAADAAQSMDYNIAVMRSWEKAIDDAWKAGDKLWEEHLSGADKMHRKMEKLTELFDAGFVDPLTFARESQKIVADSVGVGDLSSPAENFTRQRETLESALADGLITSAQFGTGLEKALKALEGAAGMGGAPELLRGSRMESREAQEAIVRHQMGDDRDSMQERIDRAMAEVEAQARRTADGVQELIRLAQAQGRPIIVNGNP